jgi:histidine triad (HIT) family protein
MAAGDVADCIFCRIVSGELPASVIHRDDRCIAIMDIRPVNPGHMLVIPLEHRPYLADIDEAGAAHLMRVGHRLAAAVRTSGVRCEGVNLFLADGKAAMQEVFHVHLHVIPRVAGDGFGLRFGPNYDTLPPRAELDRIAATVRDALGSTSTRDSMPRLHGVLEACVYAADLDAVEGFYAETLGLEAFAREPDRFVFFRAGPSNVFLLFNPARSRDTSDRPAVGGVPIPGHGTDGPGHVAFAVADADIDAWRDRFIHANVDIEAEVAWPRGGRSLYVRDPAGNSVELASPRIWGLREPHASAEP